MVTHRVLFHVLTIELLVILVYGKPQIEDYTAPEVSSNENEKTTFQKEAEHAAVQLQFSNLFDWSKKIDNLYRTEENVALVSLNVLTEIAQLCPTDSFFTSTNTNHMKAVGILKSIILQADSEEKAMSTAAYLRDQAQVHPHAWVRAVYAASMIRRDWRRLRKPPVWTVIPSSFVPEQAIDDLHMKMRDAIFRDTEADDETCVKVNGFLNTNNGEENKLWYFREDIALNAFNWNWHLTYPSDEENRHYAGELFYFANHEMLARYKTERISNRMRPIEPFEAKPGQEIPLKFHPNLLEGYTKQRWADRSAGKQIVDVYKDDLEVFAHKRQYQRELIQSHVNQRFLIDEKWTKFSLEDDFFGTEYIGETLMGSVYSMNPELYGNSTSCMYASGNILTGRVMDPTGSQPPGVLEDTSVAMRDPMFYMLMMDIDRIVTQHKIFLPPYDIPTMISNDKLTLLEVYVELVDEVVHPTYGKNILVTFWNNTEFDLSKGLDFQSNLTASAKICQYHLEHKEFNLGFKSKNSFTVSNTNTEVVVRAYMYPLYDENDNKLSFEQERLHVFTVDIFKTYVAPGSQSDQVTNSYDSFVTVGRSDYIGKGKPRCDCGWPSHMLIPKGRPNSTQGLKMGLFVIATVLAEEEQRRELSESEVQDEENCLTVYCGFSWGGYLSMGFPFDRRFDESIPPNYTIEEFARSLPNAAYAPITIFHEGAVTNFTIDR